MPEEILETPQPVTESKHLARGQSSSGRNWPKIILAAVLGFGLLAGAAYAGYYYGTQQIQLEQEPLPEGVAPPPEPSSSYLYCESNDNCFWYEEMVGDPAGRIHCAGVNYQKTCAACKKLSVDVVRNLPENWKCVCNLSLNGCVENR